MACCLLLQHSTIVDARKHTHTHQVAADANTAAQTYPDQSLYPADAVPKIVERINNVISVIQPVG